MDNNSMFQFLCGLYSSSGAPAAVRCGGKIWENAHFRKVFSVMDPSAKPDFFSDIADRNGTYYFKSDEKLYTANIMHADDITVAELIKEDDLLSIFRKPGVREYMHYVIKRMRGTVSSIFAAANTAYNFNVKAEDMPSDIQDSIAAAMNTIDRNLCGMISDLIEPEQIVLLLDSDSPDSTISVADTVSRIIREVRSAAGSSVRFETDYSFAAFARINRAAFRTILTDAVSKLCSGKYIPDSIKVSTSVRGDDLAEIVLSSDCSSRRVRGDASGKKNAYDGIFFDYVCELFCAKYGGSFTFRKTEKGESFTICFPAILSGQLEMASPDVFITLGHFDAVSIRFNNKAYFRTPSEIPKENESKGEIT